MNRVFAVGAIVSKPELRQAGNSDVLKFRMSSVETGFNGKEYTTWLSVQQWGKSAQASAARFNEGDTVIVSGSIKTETYEKNGQKQYVTSINATSIEPVGVVRSNHATERSSAPQQRVPHDDFETDGDIPF